jgi:hypothetical protein
MKDSGILAAVFHLDVSTFTERERSVDVFFWLDNRLFVAMFKI